METEVDKQPTTYTAQEVEEIVFLEEVEKELESVEQSFDSGDMQSFGRNKSDVVNRFLNFRRRDEEVFHRHCDVILKANNLANTEEKEEIDEEEEIKEQKKHLVEIRKNIQDKTSELRKVLNEINGFIADCSN